MSDPEFPVPIVLVAFNRPELTRRTLEAIRSIRPARLWQVLDGPRESRSEDQDHCSEVRRILNREVDWPCRVERLWSDHNMGCARRVVTGLDQVFSIEESAIILEDDCLPDQTFFRFCEELLRFYSDDDRVAAISGDSFQHGIRAGEASYHFSRYPHCWGWATWRRAWRDFDYSMSGWPDPQGKDWLAAQVSSRAEFRYWRHAFDRTLEGEIDSWANRWTYSCWRHQRVSILPEVNLVSNIGFGTDATHTIGESPVASLATRPIAFPLVHPEEVRVDDAADSRTARLMFSRPRFPMRLASRIGRYLQRKL